MLPVLRPLVEALEVRQMRLHSEKSLERVESREDADVEQQASRVMALATRETLERVVKGVEGVVEGASGARRRPETHEPLEKGPGTAMEEEGTEGVREVSVDSVEALEHPHVDELLVEALHPHPLAFAAVEEGVGVSLEAEVKEERHPLRHQQSSRLVSLWQLPQSHFGDRGWRLGN